MLYWPDFSMPVRIMHCLIYNVLKDGLVCHADTNTLRTESYLITGEQYL